VAPIAQQLRQALDWSATTDTVLIRDQAAESLWEECYPDLSQARPGLFGAATSRAEAQVLRLSAVYAALDCSSLITVPHLEAALATWEYCSATASELFGTSTGDITADRIKVAIEESKVGLSRDQIRGLFHGHVTRDKIEAALEQLMSLGVLTHHIQAGRGRPASIWSALPAAEAIDAATPPEGT
jgi:DNA replicative helicase MCM subunit Mcm2 (Cdc46/Mcm family)